MIVDTSAIVAILNLEHEAQIVTDALSGSDESAISAGSYLEASIVLKGGRQTGRLAVVTPNRHRARHHRADAYRAFGKGLGHAAALNFGDCFAYALAIDKRLPLLFKGANFARTDVRRAL